MITKKIRDLHVIEFPPSRRTFKIKLNDEDENPATILQLFLSLPFVQIFYPLNQLKGRFQIPVSNFLEIPIVGISFTEDSVFEDQNQQMIHLPLPNIIFDRGMYLLYTHMIRDQISLESVVEMLKTQLFETVWSFENREWTLTGIKSNLSLKEIYQKWERKSEEERVNRLPPYSKVDFPKLKINFLELTKNVNQHQ